MEATSLINISINDELARTIRLNRNEFVNKLNATPQFSQDTFNLIIENQFLDPSFRDMIFDFWYESKIKNTDFWNNDFPCHKEMQSLIYSCNQYKEKFPKSNAGNLALGSINFILGNNKNSCDYYMKAKVQTDNGEFLHRASLGIYTVASLEEIIAIESDTPPTPEWLSKLQFITEPEKNSSTPLILTACDEVYFAAFGEKLLTSIIKYDSAKQLHFHVVNPTAYTFDKLQKLEKLCSLNQNARVSLSVEFIDVLDLNACYTTIRLMRINEFLLKTNRSIVIIDTDSELSGDLTKSINDRHGNIGIRRFPTYPGFHPW